MKKYINKHNYQNKKRIRRNNRRNNHKQDEVAKKKQSRSSRSPQLALLTFSVPLSLMGGTVVLLLAAGPSGPWPSPSVPFSVGERSLVVVGQNVLGF